MIEKKLLVSFMVLFIIIFNFVIINAQYSSSSPSPSKLLSLTSSPTSFPTSSPSPTPIESPSSSPAQECSGEASIELNGNSIKNFGEEDNVETIKENLKKMAQGAYTAQPHIVDFLACTYPSDYSCPSGCYTNFYLDNYLSIVPTTKTVTPTGAGTITYSKDGQLQFTVSSTSGAINSVTQRIMEELQNVLDNAPTCPAGYARDVYITVTEVTFKYHYIPYTKIVYSVTITVKYRVVTTCTKLEDEIPTSATLTLSAMLIKRCEKEYKSANRK